MRKNLKLVTFKDANPIFAADLFLWVGRWAKENGFDSPSLHRIEGGDYELSVKEVDTKP